MADMAAHNAHPPGFAHQFETMDQQRDSATLGMWVFLVTEIMFFGGMFTSYTIYRALHLPAFIQGSHQLIVKFGATNTAVLIFSSLTMALAIRSAQVGKKKGTIIFWLVLTWLLGAAFIAIKLRFEWYRDWLEGLIPGVHWFYNTPPYPAGVKMFMCFYFFMTGLHAIHMEEDALFLGDLSDFRDRLHHSDFVVRVHDADEFGVGADGCL